MFVLDTNVVSELMKDRSAQNAMVAKWADHQSPSHLFITTITVAEILGGIAVLPRGARRSRLHAEASAVFQHMEGQCLDFDFRAAEAFAVAIAKRRAVGKTTGTLDGCILGIARANAMAVATRDVAGFEAAGVEIVDPWSV